MVPTDGSTLLLPEDFTSRFSGAVLLTRQGNKITVKQTEGVCVICGEIAVEYLFGKGVCDICIRYAKTVLERGY